MIYEYKCDNCQLPVEIKKPMKDAERKEKCQQCGYVMRRVYSPLATVWGLGGWDYDKEGMGDDLILRHHD
uniref:Putative regulatory protein FmdB zinc ribbon domain-containing protein n=1 Tax=viral metagenome TaxID=1070528 RepID=A0A6M3J525_9ZZZZ